MDLTEAATRFRTAMSYCDDVVLIHRQAGSGGRGRRNEETTLNRAVIVMAVAGWQVAVQNLTRTGIDQAQSQSGSANISAYSGLVKGAIKRFSTANSQTSRELLLSVGYDPRPDWIGAQLKAPGRKMQPPPNQPSLPLAECPRCMGQDSPRDRSRRPRPPRRASPATRPRTRQEVRARAHEPRPSSCGRRILCRLHPSPRTDNRRRICCITWA